MLLDYLGFDMQIIKGNLVDVFNDTITPAAITIDKGKIVEITRNSHRAAQFIIPGFVDAHIHIESTLLVPSEFARLVVRHGTVGVVADPHEIANVLGIQGVEYMIENAKTVPFKTYYGAPSCVPATPFETAGATLGLSEIRTLLQKKEVKCLSEMMNFVGVIHKDPEVMQKIKIAHELKKSIDGHAPQLHGEDLKKYCRAGISTDHECTSFSEAKEKIALGMKIMIREGSAARNFSTLSPLLFEHPDQCMFCTDDIYPENLMAGHINLLVKRAVQQGVDPIQAVRVASLNPIQHYQLDIGLLRENDPADFVIVEDLKNFKVFETYISGNSVFKENKVLFPRAPITPINHFNTTFKKPQDFQVPVQKGNIKVIEAVDGEIITHQLLLPPKVAQGQVISDIERDILKIAVVNRYNDAQPAIGFIKNFGLKSGAIASSVAHDSHNIVAIGTNDEVLCHVVNAIIEHKGGLALIDDKLQLHILPLPIAGLMSDLNAEEVARLHYQLEQKVKQLGSSLKSPFMTLSFMALLVIPELKLSDLGLFDGKAFKLTSLYDNP